MAKDYKNKSNDLDLTQIQQVLRPIAQPERKLSDMV